MNLDIFSITPTMVAGVLLGLLVLGAMLLREKFLWLGVGGLLFLGGLGFPLEYDLQFGVRARSFLYPLQMQRSPLYVMCGLALLVAAVWHGMRGGRMRVPGATILALVLGLFVAAMIGYHDSPAEGIMTALVYATSLPAVAITVSLLVRDRESALDLPRTIAWVGVVWIACVALQMVIDRSAVTLGKEFRFLGVASNPQHAGLCVATFGVMYVFLSWNDTKLRTRWLWMSGAAICLVMIAWTGSRTGAAMFVLGASAVSIARLGRAVLLMPIVALALLGVAQLVSDEKGFMSSLERLTSRENTRAGGWSMMLENGLDNPVLGVGTKVAGGSENSLLYAFASYGALGVILVFVLLALMGWWLLRLTVRRGSFAVEPRQLVMLCIGFYLMYGFGSQFEGYVIARISIMVPLFVLFTTLDAQLRRSDWAYEERSSQLELDGEGEQDSLVDPNAAAAYERG